MIFFFQTYQSNSFFKDHFVVCNVLCIVLETYLFDTKL